MQCYVSESRNFEKIFHAAVFESFPFWLRVCRAYVSALPTGYPSSHTPTAYASSKPRMEPVEEANLSVSRAMRCSMETNMFGSG